MEYRWAGEVLFATSPNERFKKAKLKFWGKYIDVEMGLAMGLMRASHKVDYGDVDGFLRRDDMLELHLRTADGLGRRWLFKTPRVDELVPLLSELHIQEKPRSLEPVPVIAQQPPPPPPEQVASIRALSPSVKFALTPGRWTSAKLTLTKDALEVVMYEFLGMMARPTKVTIELRALKSFSRSDMEILILHIESKPEYGLGGDWFISTKQRDQWAEALLDLGIPETKSN